ncbi:MAG: hypothetical protein ACI84K_000064 [Pseudohongiellaceae bacterium]|jgi:hypothetical protein
MNNTRSSDLKNNTLNEFCDFVEAEPMSPSAKTESHIMNMVQKDLCPPKPLVFGKFLFIEVFTGVITLFMCPQFGLGFGGHNEFLHSLHETFDPFTFYVICGFLFVIAGSVLSGLFLSHDEIRSIKNSKYAYYPVYALITYFMFFLLSVEILILSAIPWILGSIMGNALGFGLASKARA